MPLIVFTCTIMTLQQVFSRNGKNDLPAGRIDFINILTGNLL